jgi:hypothetical protein
MNNEKKQEKEKTKKEKKQLRKKKKNALVICSDGREYWTTQVQFWQWIRDNVIVKEGDGPLRGKFLRENEEYHVVISNTVLNLRHPNHLSEALYTRRKAFL